MSQSLSSYLLVRVGSGHVVALAVERVVEVCRPAKIALQTGIAPPVLGFVTLHGSTVVVLDLALLLGLRAEQVPIADSARLVHVRLDPRNAALLVDEVIGVRQLPSGQFEAIDLPEAESRSIGRFEDGFAALIEVSRLIPPELAATPVPSFLGLVEGTAQLRIPGSQP